MNTLCKRRGCGKGKWSLGINIHSLYPIKGSIDCSNLPWIISPMISPMCWCWLYTVENGLHPAGLIEAASWCSSHPQGFDSNSYA